MARKGGMDYLYILASLLLASTYVFGQQVNVRPRELVVKEGDPFEFVCHIGLPLDYCSIQTPTGKSYRPKPGAQGANLGFEYYGKGFESGECGARFDRSDSSHNGLFLCSLGSPQSNEEFKGNMNLIVAKPPQQPELILAPRYSQDEDYNEGETLEATCKIRNGRPAANITWFMGDEQIYSGLSQRIEASEQPGLFSVLQNISRTLSWHDHGKKLRCVAQHIAVEEQRELSSEATIQVRYPPQPSKTSIIDLYSFELGKEGLIAVNVSANPNPTFVWKVDKTELVERESNAEYVVEQGRMIESGKWEARLRINKVSQYDIEKNFVLTASNELGHQSYTIRISSKPASEETDLGTMAIIGIIVAVLIVFLAGLLVCFARITGRWCFAEKPEKESRSGSEAHIDPEVPAPNKIVESAAGVPLRSDKESDPSSPTHAGGFHGFWAKLTPNYRSVSTMDDLPPVQITLPPETPLNLNLAQPEPTQVAPPVSNPPPSRVVPLAKQQVVAAPANLMDTNIDEEESGGALHSSDTESADRAPVTTSIGEKKSFFKKPAFLNKNKTASKQVPMEDVKVDEVKQKNAGVGGDNDGVVYAELDLAGAQGRKTGTVPVVRREDDKTEYAEIMHTKPV